MKLKLILVAGLVVCSLGLMPSGVCSQISPDSIVKPSYPIVSKRNPWAASLRSCLAPGWGQIYNGEKKKGMVMIGIFVPAVVWYFTDSDYDPNTGRHSPPSLPAGLIFSLEIWSAVDAYISAKRINRLNGYGLTRSLGLQLGMYPCPRDPKKCQVGLTLVKGF